MNKIITTFSLLVLVAISFFACTEINKVSDSSSAVNKYPALLDRPELLQNGKEWEHVQNVYSATIKDLKSEQPDPNSYLTLTKVCISEARVTGEHGHYYPSALEVIDELLNHGMEIPQDILFQALSLKSSVLLSQHEFEDALVSTKQAITLNPYNAQIYGSLTDALVELGQYENAVKAVDKMVSIRPDLRSYARISYMREIHGDIDGAIKAMNMAVKAGYPGLEQTAWTRLTLGNIYQTYGQPEKAKRAYETVLVHRENYPFAYGALASLEMEKENYTEAEKLLKQAADIIPEFSFYVQLAEVYKNTDRPELFEKTIKEIMEMLQDDVDHGHNMNLEYADIHLRLTEDYEKGLEYTLDEYSKRPKNIDVNKMLSALYLKMGDEEKSKSHLSKATITNSKNPELVDLKDRLVMR